MPEYGRRGSAAGGLAALSIRGGSDIPKEFGGISIGFGCYLNILASLVLAAGAVLQAKRTNVF